MGSMPQGAPPSTMAAHRAVEAVWRIEAAKLIAGLVRLVRDLETAEELALEGYHLLPAVRGDLLVKLGRMTEARAELERAAAMTRNARERDLLRDRARACGGQGTAFP